MTVKFYQNVKKSYIWSMSSEKSNFEWHNSRMINGVVFQKFEFNKNYLLSCSSISAEEQ